ncbi:MAG: hypothetical protein RR512_09470 [Coprobacillus sp.]
MEKLAYLIYLEDNILLSKKDYHHWKEIQAEFFDKYKTSLEALSCKEIIDFFTDDFKDETSWPFTKKQIIDFFKSEDVILYSIK